jgi:hypothetical protein
LRSRTWKYYDEGLELEFQPFFADELTLKKVRRSAYKHIEQIAVMEKVMQLDIVIAVALLPLPAGPRRDLPPSP